MVAVALQRLQETLTVKLIMTARENLLRAGNQDEAQPLHAAYDVVPFPREGSITGFFRRGKKERQEITPSLLISDGSQIIHLPGLLLPNGFCFIISGNEITGYVHHSDMNKTVAKLPLLALICATENELWRNVKATIKPEDLIEVFGEGKYRQIQKKLDIARKKRVETGWAGIFCITESLKLARHFGVCQATDAEIGRIGKLRNRCAHSGGGLIDKRDDLQELETVRQLCARML